MMNKLKFDILPKKQKILLDLLSEIDWLSNFYLAGGTALALQLGHRQSIDFDFFTKKEFSNEKFISYLNNNFQFELLTEYKNTLHCLVNKVNVSFLEYEYQTLEKFIIYKNIKIASKIDIALMKLSAISNRGNKKDFIDLYYLLKIFPLKELLILYGKKYGASLDNSYHILKSLIYFNDAEEQPMPLMLEKISWDEIKKQISYEVKKIK